jgi:hypothetical protein
MKITNAINNHGVKENDDMGNQTDGRQIRSKSEKIAIEKGQDVEPKEFSRGNGSQNNRIPNTNKNS